MNTEPLTGTQLEGRLGRVRAGVRRKIGRRRRVTTIGAGLGLSAALGGAGMAAAGAGGSERLDFEAVVSTPHLQEYAQCLRSHGIDVATLGGSEAAGVLQSFKASPSGYSALRVSYLADQQPRQAAAADECEAVRGPLPSFD